MYIICFYPFSNRLLAYSHIMAITNGASRNTSVRASVWAHDFDYWHIRLEVKFLVIKLFGFFLLSFSLLYTSFISGILIPFITPLIIWFWRYNFSTVTLPFYIHNSNDQYSNFSTSSPGLVIFSLIQIIILRNTNNCS